MKRRERLGESLGISSIVRIAEIKIFGEVRRTLELHGGTADKYKCHACVVESAKSFFQLHCLALACDPTERRAMSERAPSPSFWARCVGVSLRFSTSRVRSMPCRLASANLLPSGGSAISS